MTFNDIRIPSTFFDIILAIILGVVKYILNSRGYFVIASKKGEKNAFISWIPFARIYLKGKIAFSNIKISVMYIVFHIAIIAMWVSYDELVLFFNTHLGIGIPITVILIIAILLTNYIFNFVCMYKIYKQFIEDANLMIVISVILNLVSIFNIFKLIFTGFASFTLILIDSFISSMFIFEIKNNNIQ